MKFKASLVAATGLAGMLVASSAMASEPHVAPMQDYANSTVKNWVANADLVAAIKAQNEKHAGLAQADIDAMDKKWRAETGASSHPMIDEVMGRAVSSFLAQVKDESEGLVTEVFVMDARGLNVAQSDVTSDYWQGDEAKWKKTYLVGPDAVFVDEVEEDESTQTFQSQLSMSIVDPASGEVIGAITVGMNVDAFL
ncbi:hypothetical protein [Pelagibius sp. Alg239-R121]|uniref:hypothetical protein n=1 Tax=Pelagibius sp. Alg239-R121 TaxID=2993448 RepID=UPI0024A7A440|nr:hypothetical protein [Pelagibius sp. Alg239-R121]